jgi:cation diffusion facilitator CzcD-associated flavoprotein CzcO
MTVVDADALRRRYAIEREKRLRPDAGVQYRRVPAGQLADPYLPVVAREPCRDQVDFTFIGGGFAGLVTGARLREAGIERVRIVEKAGDFGGTWYWNRYPGAQCDTAAIVYLPLLEETGYVPSEKYTHAPEILEHCRRIARHYDLYRDALFHTAVTALEWDDAASAWIVVTDRGDRFSTRFVGMGTGPLHVPKLPAVEGIEQFQGHAFHTSRWDYAYTGGDPEGAPMERLAERRVAIVGTGATAVQCIPALARDAGELYVFQRTPSSVDVRANAPTDLEWFASIAEPGWQKRWLENFTANTMGGFGSDAQEDLVADGWTDISRRVRAKVADLTSSGRPLDVDVLLEAFESADFEKMSEIRARVDAEVLEPAVAADLKAWYGQLCKRPCFHDEYLPAFNRPGVHVVDTDGRGIQRITERGVVVAGREYEVDCIVWATGFEVGTDHAARAGFDPVGRDGVRLSEWWSDGMRTLHGIHVHGFPNAFIVQLTQGSNHIANVPHNMTESGTTIAAVVAEAIASESRTVEVTAAAEDAWIQRLLGGGSTLRDLAASSTRSLQFPGSPSCTPGYYNNEGLPPSAAQRFNFLGFPGGPLAFFRYIEDWRTSGDFTGLEFR